MTNSVKKNFLYNIVYQILILIIPFLTIPYVSRKLGVDGIGIYSFTYSIVYYFMIFAMLGLNNYGNRAIAKVRDDKEKLSSTFKEIHFLQILSSSIMIIIYLIYIIFICKDYILVSYAQLLYIISCMFDVNWFFFGMEKFKLTITRNIIIKLISLVLIFTLVRKSDDILIYTFILSGGTLLSQILLWPYIRKIVAPKKIDISSLKKHILPCLKLFLPVIAVTIYKVMDKTMLGIFSSIGEVGYYENAEKVISVPITVITALGTVMLPRMSNIYANKKTDESKKIIGESMKLIMFLSCAMAFGLVTIGQDFSVVFFGKNFAKTGILIMCLAITILFLAWGNVIRTQYLIPKEKDKEYIVSAFIGAIINLIMNFIFIPMYGSVGACIGTVCAELSVVLYQTYKVKDNLPIAKYLIDSIPFVVKSAIMMSVLLLLRFLKINSLKLLVFQVIIGVIIYFILNINYIILFFNTNKKNKRHRIC